jgi:glycosyltransferase involved in cell wall biosynthesis
MAAERDIAGSLKRRPALLLCSHHSGNKGKGRALKTGLAYIKENFPKDSVVVTLDADGQHTVKDAIRVCRHAAENPGCLLLGSRSFGGDVPARSRFGNSVTRFVYRLSTGTQVNDTQTGLRAFGFEMIPLMLGVEGERYEYEMNVLLECSRQNIPIKEVEIETIYLNNNSASHFNTLKDSFRVYREIIKFAASSFTGFVVDYGMYSLLVILTGGLGTSVSIPISNIIARITSASVNYSINKRYVFQNKDSVAKTATQYFVLAACILAGNTTFSELSRRRPAGQ